MPWQGHRVVLRLLSPMHIGHGEVGNIQRTRPYVLGRVLLGALTSRLTRDRFQGQGPADRFDQYHSVGEEVHASLAFTYFYPTTDPHGAVKIWPWDAEFQSKFLTTYAGTALVYPDKSADEGTLHETEFIPPRTLDSGQQVYLAGYVFARGGAPQWISALRRVQLGGERGYGWGRVDLAGDPVLWDGAAPFDGKVIPVPETWPPVLVASQGTRLLAHTVAYRDDGLQPVEGIQGRVEPLVGRETN